MGGLAAAHRTFSTQPYTQLAGVLLAAGRRESAEAIQYASRVRQRGETEGWLAWAWLVVWGGVAGYGIGSTHSACCIG